MSQYLDDFYRSIGQPQEPTINPIYQALAQAETGNEQDPWIRTKHRPEQGSTAYGPVQLTRSLAEGYRTKQADMFEPNELEYLDRFLQQGDLFNHYGAEPDREGYDPRFDYGGGGNLNTPEDQALYQQVTGKMINEIFERNDGDLEKTWSEWRFGPKGGKDERYAKAFYKKLKGGEPSKEEMAQEILEF